MFSYHTSSYAKNKSHNIYVIELSKAVLELKKFRLKNPDYVESMPCVYVGLTGKSPQERFNQHKAGYKSSSIVKRFGLYLRPRQYQNHNPMTFYETSVMEFEKARRLRKKCWGVWVN